jgi:hypothetical protein
MTSPSPSAPSPIVRFPRAFWPPVTCSGGRLRGESEGADQTDWSPDWSLRLAHDRLGLAPGRTA